jgi:hypothetical protein
VEVSILRATTLFAIAAGIPNGSRLFVSNKVDLLLVIDNSISMSDEQAVLSKTVSDLVAQIRHSAP